MGSDGSPYEKRVDAKGRVLSDVCIADEVPFEELPEGWAWARLATICQVKGGKRIPAGRKLSIERTPQKYIRVSDMQNTTVLQSDVRYVPVDLIERLSRYTISCNDLYITVAGSIGRVGLIPESFNGANLTENADKLVFFLPLNKQWLCGLLASPMIQSLIKEATTQVGQPKLAIKRIETFLLPIPPLAEQRRIVEHANQLMPLLEEYGKLEDAREALDAALPGRLRKSVLQMAVQGKLVPQDPTDEPASALLKRIREQRRQLIAEKKMKAPKGGESVIFRGSDGRRYEKRIDSKGRESDPTCIEDEIPFEIPGSWEWARLGSLCNFGKCQNIEYGCVAVGTWNLDLEDIEKETGTILRKKLKAAGENGSTKHIFDAGMVLYSKLRPYLNKVVVADEGGVCSSEILPLDFGQLNAEYAQLALMEPGFVEYAKGCAYGVKMPRLGTEDGKQWLVAIPPLPEQHRIVAAFKIFTMNAF